MASDDNSIVFKRSRFVLTAVFAMFIALSALFGFVGLMPMLDLNWPLSDSAWLAVLFLPTFIGHLVNVGFKLIRNSTDIVMTGAGFHDRMSRFGLVPWSDIVDAAVDLGRRPPALILNLRNHAAYDRHYRWRNWFMLGDSRPESSQIILFLTGLRDDPGEFLAAVQQKIDARRVRTVH